MSDYEIPDAFVRANNARILSSLAVIAGTHLQGPDELIKSSKIDSDDIQAEAKAFLWDIHNRPYVMTTERFRTIDVGGRKLSAGGGTRIVKSLLSKNLLRVHKINLGGRGGSAKFLELTDKGHEMLGVQPKNKIGKGAGFEHEYWQHHCSETLRNIYGVQSIAVEGILLDKSIDILIETENEKIALEIEMTPDHAIVNVEKDLRAGCSAVFTGCKDKAVLESITRSLEALSEELKQKVHICLVQKIAAEIENYLKSEH
jgi:hypothetical protein